MALDVWLVQKDEREWDLDVSLNWGRDGLAALDIYQSDPGVNSLSHNQLEPDPAVEQLIKETPKIGGLYLTEYLYTVMTPSVETQYFRGKCFNILWNILNVTNLLNNVPILFTICKCVKTACDKPQYIYFLIALLCLFKPYNSISWTNLHYISKHQLGFGR